MEFVVGLIMEYSKYFDLNNDDIVIIIIIHFYMY